MSAKTKDRNARNLFDSDDDEDEQNRNENESSIKINKKFAAEFTLRKQKEELRKVIFEVPDGDDDDASTSSSEDEDANLLTTKLDVNILKTINALRDKDSRIYDPNVRFFESVDDEDDEAAEHRQKKKKSKTKLYKDYVREQVLEQLDKDEPDDVGSDDEEENVKDTTSKSRLAYDAEQEKIRQAFLEGVQDSDNDESSDEMIVRKKKSKSKIEDDDDDDSEEARKEFEKEIERLKQTSTGRKETIKDPKGEIKDGEEFLLNFFKNRPWVENESDKSSDDESSDDEKKLPYGSTKRRDSDEDSLDEVEQADDFEAKYNFRFEEAAAAAAQSGADASLQQYARGQTMNTLRRTDTTRRDKRKARAERKAAERKAVEEELKRLKNAKRQLMQEKIRQVKAVLGDVDEKDVDEAALMKLMEGDYDPDKFEELMKEVYKDDFYEKEDKHWKTDKDVRETLLKTDDDGELLVGQDDADGGLYDVEDEGELADTEGECDENDGGEDEDWDGDADEYEVKEDHEESQLEKKLKEKMEDELYKLDFEDIVAGMPTRFKYKQVKPNNYGLSTEEILLARDTTLKQFVSLKKMAPYSETEHFVGSRKRRRFREMLKKDIEQEYGADGNDNEEKDEEPKKEESEEKDYKDEGQKKKKKRRRLKKKSKKDSTESKSDDKKDSKMTASTKAVEVDNVVSPKKSEEGHNEEKRKSKKRKRKKKKSANENHPEEGKKEKERESNGSSLEVLQESSSQDKKESNGIAPDVVQESPSQDEKTRSNEREKDDQQVKKQKKKKKHKRKKVEGLSHTRLASYGL